MFVSSMVNEADIFIFDTHHGPFNNNLAHSNVTGKSFDPGWEIKCQVSGNISPSTC